MPTFNIRRACVLGALLATLAPVVSADSVAVEHVQFRSTNDHAWTVSVRLRHADSGLGALR
jgi:hypothetical protein